MIGMPIRIGYLKSTSRVSEILTQHSTDANIVVPIGCRADARFCELDSLLSAPVAFSDKIMLKFRKVCNLHRLLGLREGDGDFGGAPHYPIAHKRP
jgi:redox-regulated HSP33 family molecular chaperone